MDFLKLRPQGAPRPRGASLMAVSHLQRLGTTSPLLLRVTVLALEV